MTTNELEEYVEVEDNSPTVAEIYKQRKGKEINIDYFLYSCLEQDRTREATTDTANTFKTPILSDEGSLKDLSPEEALEDIIAWFKSEWPILKMSHPIDVSCLAEYIPGFISMLHEIESFFKAKNGIEELPKRKEDRNENDNIWKVLDSNLERFFPKHHTLMSTYLDWRFSSVEKETLDLNSIPPVGRFTKMHLKMRDNSNRSSGRGAGGRPSNNRSNNNNRPNSGNRPNNNSRPNSGNKPTNNRGNSQDKKFNDRGPKGRPDKQKNKEREIEVLNEVKKNLELLKTKSDLKEIILKPQNSFLRRIQHQSINDAGFISESSGEGKERAVKILNK